MVVGELKAGREAKLTIEAEIGEAVEPFHFQAVARKQCGVLLFRIFAIRVPAKNNRAGRECGEEFFLERQFFRVLRISRKIMEEHFLAHPPVRHAWDAHGADVPPHEHNGVVRAARPIAGHRIGVNLGIGLPRVAPPQVIDEFQAMLLDERDKGGRDDEGVIEPGNSKRHIHRRRHGRIPDYIALCVL